MLTASFHLISDANRVSDNSATSRQDGTTRLSDDSSERLPGGGASRHRQRQDPGDWSMAGRRRDVSRGDDAVGADFLNSDPEAVDDSLIGCDSDLEFGHRGHSSQRNHGHSRRIRGNTSYRLFIALFDYDPVSMSPNPGAIEEELPFCEGQLIKVRPINFCF